MVCSKALVDDIIELIIMGLPHCSVSFEFYAHMTAHTDSELESIDRESLHKRTCKAPSQEMEGYSDGEVKLITSVS